MSHDSHRESTSVGIFVDYESPLARRVAGAVWSGLSRAALDSGNTSISASWESLSKETVNLPETNVRLFAIGQDRPDVIDEIRLLAGPSEGGGSSPELYGIVVAAPEVPNPLVGSLLYQGVEHLKGNGVRVGLIEPAILRAESGECDSYAQRIFQRLTRNKASRNA